MSPEVQNRGISGPINGHLSNKNLKEILDLLTVNHIIDLPARKYPERVPRVALHDACANNTLYLEITLN